MPPLKDLAPHLRTRVTGSIPSLSGCGSHRSRMPPHSSTPLQGQYTHILFLGDDVVFLHAPLGLFFYVPRCSLSTVIAGGPPCASWAPTIKQHSTRYTFFCATSDSGQVSTGIASYHRPSICFEGKALKASDGKTSGQTHTLTHTQGER